jgi:hypothetical protein
VEVDVQGLCFWTYWVQKGRMPYAESSNLRVLDLLSDVCDAVAWRQTDALSPDDFDDYSNYLDILDFRLRNLALPDPARESPDFAVVVELFQLAALVYLHRANANVLDAAARTQQYVDRAFVLFAQLPTCSRQFPLFILGSEARTDEQRAVVLDLMERTSRSASSRSLNHVRILLNAVWAQDDLAESEWGKGSEVGYWEKISGVISACSIVPSLV